jgi:hypothetical protein
MTMSPSEIDWQMLIVHSVRALQRGHACLQRCDLGILLHHQLVQFYEKPTCLSVGSTFVGYGEPATIYGPWRRRRGPSIHLRTSGR